MTCDQHLLTLSGIATDDYVDCRLTTVSGHLQNQIQSSPGIWEVLATEELSSASSTVTVSNIPNRDFLKVYLDIIYDKSSSTKYFVRMNDSAINDHTDHISTSFDNKALLVVDANTNPNPSQMRCVMEINNVDSEVKSWVSSAFFHFNSGWVLYLGDYRCWSLVVQLIPDLFTSVCANVVRLSTSGPKS